VLPAAAPVMMEFFGSITLNPAGKKLSGRVLSPNGEYVGSADGVEKAMTYGSMTAFDSQNSLKIFICTNPSGPVTFNCEIKAVRLWWTYIKASEAPIYLYEIYRNFHG